jgi:hypothetical protein
MGSNCPLHLYSTYKGMNMAKVPTDSSSIRLTKLRNKSKTIKLRPNALIRWCSYCGWLSEVKISGHAIYRLKANKPNIVLAVIDIDKDIKKT